MSYLVAIDQGTTSTRAIVFRAGLDPVAVAQREFAQHYPQPGWVEHDAEDLWATTVATVSEAMARAGLKASDIAAIGLTNQRETTLVWDRRSGKAIHRAIVWQDRRTASVCADMKAQGREALVTEKSGLLLDAYFSATKIGWILDTVPGAREAAMRGDLAFGTVDSFLIWRLTGGRVHATDATNAARTLLYNIHDGRFDEELLDLFRIPGSMLPEVRDNAGSFGETLPQFFGGPIAIRGVAGDQQAATVGQACFTPGMAKVTYGTGAFALVNTGSKPVRSENRLLTTIAYQLDGVPTYALEGAIFVAGAAVQWLRDGLGIIANAAETQELAERADPAQNVYLVPAFVGLGAPWWDPEARGALHGLTRGTTRAELARAALESVGYQTRDLLAAMRRDWPAAAGADTVLRVDGGMVASDWTLQFLSDILGLPVDRPKVLETTAVGAAYLAGLAAGLCPAPDEMAKHWQLGQRFQPEMDEPRREAKYRGWRDAVSRVLTDPKT
ncbi:glycerol kinase [Agaricicola taiwanensis]|uniref:Glycerol kinase n=1 Tax=Agaricicola taiwanensis TaxID=591372 RepID=A0A8J2VL52_9RHOB|nr:glycerol kinase GlpK [Agaricicola taiwanensis]GGE30602.1 glycerol kinase [Agaricicola taiwanensis]